VFFDFALSFCAGMFICFFLVFGCSFYLLFFLFWNVVVDCCAVLLMLIFFYVNSLLPSVLLCFRLGVRLVSACYKWLRPSETLRGMSNHNIVIKTSQSISVELWQTKLHGFHLRWDLNVPSWLGGRAICCFACFLSL